VVPDVVTITLDIPGEANLPASYVEADDARLEAYRRLAALQTVAELDDLKDEWLDRYGALPAPAQGLLDLGLLRLTCLERGITNLQVLPAKVGVRSKPLLKVQPLTLTLSQQMRARRLLGQSQYDETTKEFKVELDARQIQVPALTQLIVDLTATS